jgi:purine-nucleoside phosphorylase
MKRIAKGDRPVSFHRPQAEIAAATIRRLCPDAFQAGLIAGTGLGDMAGLADASVFPYQDLPHFPPATAPGHLGRLVVGRLADRPVIAFQGRFHLYEGYCPAAVTFPVRVLQALGVKCLIVSNAAGGLKAAFRPGDLMVIGDQINLPGATPLQGPNDEDWGPRFPDMARAYDPQLAAVACRAAQGAGIRCCKGVYAGLAGPSLETPAEVRYLRTIGADAVGFSTVLEVIAARHAGMRVAGLSIITNVHDPERPVAACIDEIVAVAGAAAPALAAVTAGLVAAL